MFIEAEFKKLLDSDIDSHLQPDTAKWIKFLINRKEIDTCCELKQIAADAQVKTVLIYLNIFGKTLEYLENGNIVSKCL